jgi:hypothetical protein
MGPAALLLAALNVLGFALKSSAMPNRFIPAMLLVVGGAVYPYVADYTTLTSNNPTVLAVLYGICIGGAAVGVHQAVRGFHSPDVPLPPKS